MKNQNNDKILVSIYANFHAWNFATSEGAAEVVGNFQHGRGVPYHLDHGSRRQRERALRELSQAGLVVVSGNTQARGVELTWAGICRAVALSVGADEIGKAFERMRQIVKFEKEAGGPAGPPAGGPFGGIVPEFLLGPKLGFWWQNCTPENEEIYPLERTRIFDEALPALAMRWVTITTDCHGCRWFTLTAAGRDALKNPPPLPPELPPDSLCNHWIAEWKRAWSVACKATPHDLSKVTLHVPASRWWTPTKGGEA